MAWWNPLDWPGIKSLDQFENWLGGLGGDISSGIEGGTMAVLKDLLAPFLTWFEIFAGAIIIMFTLMVYFSEKTNTSAASALLGLIR